ncbi:inositol 1,4,5-triphosphate receptor associated 1-like isoform X2 [Motacilla alba alba]|uniref:inositol 1,4,5-triphosphate receptor associated 1-like isoform X2 n=1 Tax=Motacilla alba alba TaxID=1094192 RepID=UPI0018D4FF38|nr:inositol 1,4,5-triphosphate receptor associated 1-like isoform X2 [Motacilla alba alba]
MRARGGPPSAPAAPTLPEPPARAMLRLSSADPGHGGSSPALSQPCHLPGAVRDQKQRFPGHLQPTLPALAGAGSSRALRASPLKAFSPRARPRPLRAPQTRLLCPRGGGGAAAAPSPSRAHGGPPELSAGSQPLPSAAWEEFRQVRCSWSLCARQMKPLEGTSPGPGEEEAQGPAQGRRRRQRQRASCRPSPSPRREQQAELPGLPTSPDEGRMSSPQGHPGGVLAGSEQSVEQASQEPGGAVQEQAVPPGDSDRTKEGAETLEELLSFPSELSVLDRLGLHRVALTEQDLEAAFAHLALAFRCDVFTLQQRVQVEKRARDAAEENIQEELGQCRAALERLGRSCANAGCKETLEQLQHNLAVLSAAVERATSAAEKLGAVHQEARMSRAAEVMVQHVENLKRHHLREHAELEEMKRLIQQNSRNRQLAETQDDAEPRLRPHPLKRTFQQGSARRRVSIAVIPKQLLVPALRAEQPQQVTWSQRGPSAGPAPTGVSWSHRTVL